MSSSPDSTADTGVHLLERLAPPIALEDCDDVPQSIVQFVARTRQALVLAANRVLGRRLSRRQMFVHGGANQREAQPIFADAMARPQSFLDLPTGSQRSRTRLTAPMVAAGAVAKKWLAEQYGTVFRGCMTQIGELPIAFESWAFVSHNPFFAPVADVSRLETYMDELRHARDSCGARVRVVASNVPVGLGEPLFDKMDADIAWAMMGINAVKGVEIGAGFASVAQRGTTHGDSLSPQGFRANNAGGVLGGISTGQDLEVSVAIKPTSSIITPRASIDVNGNPTEVVTKGRHDPCVGIRATPILEAMLALVVMEHALRHRAQCGDVRSPSQPIPAKA